tara:strand:- start:118 stop:498 length:381 start_codon:yes stop_codon:yes gene_type:complete
VQGTQGNDGDRRGAVGIRDDSSVAFTFVTVDFRNYQWDVPHVPKMGRIVDYQGATVCGDLLCPFRREGAGGYQEDDIHRTQDAYVKPFHYKGVAPIIFVATDNGSDRFLGREGTHRTVATLPQDSD